MSNQSTHSRRYLRKSQLARANSEESLRLTIAAHRSYASAVAHLVISSDCGSGLAHSYEDPGAFSPWKPRTVQPHGKAANTSNIRQ